MFHVVILLTIALWTDTIRATEYNVSVYTGTVFGAGTDARVYITLYGEKGNSGELELEGQGSKNNFENGQKDTFNIETRSDLGRLKKISIRHDNSWLGSAWFLEKVEISQLDGVTISFPCHKWLATNEEDGKTSRDLYPNDSHTDEHSDLSCRTAVGIHSGVIQNAQMTASSSFDEKHLPFHARLNLTVVGSRGGWCSAFSDDSEFLEVDLQNTTMVTGLATQGQSLFDNWVTSYTLAFSLNHTHWVPYMENHVIKNFTGNTDRNSVVSHWFPGIKARYVRVQPTSWSGLTNCLRMEIYGCHNETELYARSLCLGAYSNATRDLGCVTFPPSTDKQPKNETTVAPPTPGHTEFNDDKQPDVTDSDDDVTVPGSLKDKAVVYLRFEEIYQQNVIVDETKQHNDAKIVNFARISKFSEECGFGVDLNGGDVIFDGDHFHQKPRDAVTIAVWVRLFSTDGANSLFDTIGGSHSTHSNGQYHLETDGGAVRWFHRNEKGVIVFNVTTEDVIISHVWTHVAGTYDSKIGQADVYVNAKFIMRGDGSGSLSQDWQEKAGIGEHKGGRLLDGLVDEFYMADSALNQDEIKMLMNKCQFEKECFAPIGMESMRIKDSQITASSYWSPHKPFYGRLNLVAFYDDPQKTAWCADVDDQAPYLTVDLKDERTISGVAIQGPSMIENFVTSFKLCHSHSGRNFECVMVNGTEDALAGPEDKDAVKVLWINKLFDARYVRVYPMSWYGDHICLRLEIYGCMTGLLSETMTVLNDLEPEINPADQPTAEFNDCSVSCGKGVKKKQVKCQQKKNTHEKRCPSGTDSYVEKVECVNPSCPDCFSPMGMSNGSVLDTEISSSSSMDAQHSAAYARVTIAGGEGITRRGCWCAKTADTNQFVEIDLRKPRKVTGIATQGEVTADRWITQYRLTYSTNRVTWTKYTENYLPKVFEANDDADTISIRHLHHPITARFVRIYPNKWHGGNICMRAEVYGCDHQGYSMKPLQVNLTKDDLERSKPSPAKVTLPSKADSSKKIITAHSLTPLRNLHVVGNKPTVNRARINEAEQHKPNSPQALRLAASPVGRQHFIHQVVRVSQPAITRAQLQRNNQLASPDSDRYGLNTQPNTVRSAAFGLGTANPKSNTLVNSLNNMVQHAGFFQGRPVGGSIPVQPNPKFVAMAHPRPVYGNRQPLLLPSVLQDTNHQNNLLRTRQPVTGISQANRIQAYPSRFQASNGRFASGVKIMLQQSKPGSNTGNNHYMVNRPLSVNHKSVYSLNNVPLSTNKKFTSVYNRPMTKSNKPWTINNNVMTMNKRPLATVKPVTKGVPVWQGGFVNPSHQERQAAKNYLPNAFVQKFPSGPSNIFSHDHNVKNFESTLENTNKDNRLENTRLPKLQNTNNDAKLDHRVMEAQQVTSNTDRQMWQLINKKLIEVAGLTKTNVQESPYVWSAFTPCSVTCGDGTKKRHRKCKTGACHASGTETEILPCVDKKCPVFAHWSAYSPCSVTCGSGSRTRSRECDGSVCPSRGRQIETIPCRTPACPVFHLNFEKSDGSIILDQSSMSNNAFLEQDGRIVSHQDACGKVADLARYGDIRLDERTFRRKPRNGISIATWVNLHKSSRGSHSLFSTAHAPRGFGSVQGGYHFEVDDGRVRWFHRNPLQNPVFSVVTNDIIEPDKWHHIAATYDVAEGVARVYVDGELKASGEGLGPLDRDWGYKATIGSFDFYGRFLKGMLDEFYMFDYAISHQRVKSLINFKCTYKVANATTLE